VRGCPNFGDYAADYLGKELREKLGIKMNDAKHAREALKGIAHEKWLAFWADVAPEDPTRLWAPMGNCHRGEDGTWSIDDASLLGLMVAAWNRAMGPRIAMPPELIERIGALKLDTDTSEVVAMLMAPESSAALNRDADWVLAEDHEVKAKHEKAAFGLETLEVVATLIPYLYGSLPVGHELRAKAAKLLELTRARLAHPKLLLSLGSQYLSGKEAKAFRQLFESIPGQEIPHATDPDDDEVPGRRKEQGCIVAEWSTDEMSVAICPSKVKDFDDPLLVKLAKMFESSALGSLKFIMQSCPSFVERIAESPVTDGAWEANPLVSVPRLVAKVRKQQKLGEDASVLYLQMLTLLEPAKKRIEQYNGWDTARYASASQELVDRKLVITGKRPKAGREIFLPTGWEQIGYAKWNLPSIETWKASLYGMVREGTPAVLMAPPLLSRVVLTQPYHLLFESAYERVSSGEPPSYEKTR
jgi:hypothetical protein